MSETESARPHAGLEMPGGAPGPRLALERQLQNLSAAEVARHLKLSVAQVEALEAGDYHKLPGPVFARGFIRNYARLLKLDPEELVQSAGESLPHQATRPELPPSQDIPFPTAQPRRWPKYAGATAVVIGGLALYEFYWGEPATVVTRTVAPSPAPTAAAPQAPAAPAVPPVKAGSAAQPGLEPLAGPATMTASASAATTGSDTGPAPSPRAPGEPEPGARPGERRVQLTFEDESWVEVRDGRGKLIFAQLNRAGTRQAIRGMPPLSLVIGNAHGVRLTYQDKPVDLARHTKTDVARLTLE